MMIHEAIKTAISMDLSTIVVENDSQVAILTIMGKIVVSKQIFNLIKYDRSLTSTIRNVRFSYCNRMINVLMDRKREGFISCLVK